MAHPVDPFADTWNASQELPEAVRSAVRGTLADTWPQLGEGAEAVVVVTYDPDAFEDARGVAEYLHNLAVNDDKAVSDVSTYTSPS